MQSCEIKVVRRGDLSAIASLATMPTVCLLAFQTPAHGPELDLLVKTSLAIGASQFSMYGPYADELEDEIDFILEQGGESWLSVVTTSHREETPQDVASFVMYAAGPADDRFRCLVILDEQLPEADVLLRELGVESSGQPEIAEN